MRLMGLMGLQAIYRQPPYQPASDLGHKVLSVSARAASDVHPSPTRCGQRISPTCPMARGFLYLVAIMDWYSRYVVAWRLSNTHGDRLISA